MEEFSNKIYFNLILIDIYDKNLKYIAISYRWGEYDEQLVETPEYIAHITSINIWDLIRVCLYIKKEPDLKNIQYLWIDGICVDQNNEERKKEIILKMNQIYKNATYILAIPDLHIYYLTNNPANNYCIELIKKHRNIIYESILGEYQKKMNKYNIMKKLKIKPYKNFINKNRNKELKIAYDFLKYIFDDWSDRVWVISEYHIAKEKENIYGKPLKYMFMSLFSHNNDQFTYFFSYSFNNSRINNNDNQTIELFYRNEFIKFIENKLTQRTYLNMLLNSKATINEDRFNAILPSWDNYKYLIKNKDTISNWNITNMNSVRLKLYEIIDDNLWNKARLLYSCLSRFKIPIIPSFATHYDPNYNLYIGEIDNLEYSHKIYSDYLLNHVLNNNGNNKKDKEYIKISKITSEIYTYNLMDIQYNKVLQNISVKSNYYFINKYKININNLNLINFGLKDHDDNLKYVFIPYFINKIKKYSNIIPRETTGIYIFGDINKNRWILYGCGNEFYHHFNYKLYNNNYTFNIY